MIIIKENIVDVFKIKSSLPGIWQIKKMGLKNNKFIIILSEVLINEDDQATKEYKMLEEGFIKFLENQVI